MHKFLEYIPHYQCSGVCFIKTSFLTKIWEKVHRKNFFLLKVTIFGWFLLNHNLNCKNYNRGCHFSLSFHTKNSKHGCIIHIFGFDWIKSNLTFLFYSKLFFLWNFWNNLVKFWHDYCTLCNNSWKSSYCAELFRNILIALGLNYDIPFYRQFSVNIGLNWLR